MFLEPPPGRTRFDAMCIVPGCRRITEGVKQLSAGNLAEGVATIKGFSTRQEHVEPLPSTKRTHAKPPSPATSNSPIPSSLRSFTSASVGHYLAPPPSLPRSTRYTPVQSSHTLQNRSCPMKPGKKIFNQIFGSIRLLDARCPRPSMMATTVASGHLPPPAPIFTGYKRPMATKGWRHETKKGGFEGS